MVSSSSRQLDPTIPSSQDSEHARAVRLLLLLSALLLPFIGGFLGALVGGWMGATFGSVNEWDDIRGFCTGLEIGVLIGTGLAPVLLALLFVSAWKRGRL